MECGGLDAYREDGDHNAHSAEHSIIDCLPGFQRVLDGLVIAIKTPVVRLDGACLDDDEGQARFIYRKKKKKERERRGNTSVQRSRRMTYSKDHPKEQH